MLMREEEFTFRREGAFRRSRIRLVRDLAGWRASRLASWRVGTGVAELFLFELMDVLRRRCAADWHLVGLHQSCASGATEIGNPQANNLDSCDVLCRVGFYA